MESFLDTLHSGRELTRDEIRAVCAFLFSDSESVEARKQILRLMHLKGETAAEVAAFVQAVLEEATPLPLHREKLDGPLMDVCGTGGDQQGLFNVSTAVMFVAAACGIRVVKHGNRAVTSRCGGADVLEALGVRIDLEPGQVQAVLKQAGCVFLFAPTYHPILQKVAPVRKALAAEGSPSIFNLVGPLLNPARPEYQLAGVYHESLLPIYQRVFGLLGRKRAWAVLGSLGTRGHIDELSTLDATQIAAWEAGACRDFVFYPANVVLGPTSLEALRGGDAIENARLLEMMLAGQGLSALQDLVALNAGAALVVCGLADSIAEGFRTANEAIAHGDALWHLDQLRRATRTGT